MKISDWIVRQVARSLVIVLVAPFAQAQQAAPPVPEQSNSAAAGIPPSQNSQSGSSEAALGQSGNVIPDAPDAQSANTGNSQGASDLPQNGDVKPLGTAVAPYSKPSGVTGSRPAGAVIAPARQRRIRVFLISVGVVAGAAIAIGTVAALSHGSPSRP
ncbi:MAG: hypothetical protein ACLPH3_08210 [Terracidiphilus sp.]